MNGTFFCNKCGAQNAAGAQFCSRCGAPTTPTPGAVQTPGASPSPASSYPASPYSAPATSYPAVAPAVGVGYGGFWIRVVAFIIDAIIVRVVVAPVGIMFGGLGLAGGMMSGFPHRGLAILGGGVTFILLVFGNWLYEAFMESSSYQATLGKMIFGMKVTDLDGNRISFERATGRHFAKWLSGLILCIGYIMVGFTERKQGLHDLLAGTLVRRA
ncbi:MAG: RDD family protein [Terriglobales bacterium]